MTGEITLRGSVLPVGGIKEKLLAAHRAGIREVLLPARNEPDLEEVPKDVLAELTVHLIKRDRRGSSPRPRAAHRPAAAAGRPTETPKRRCDSCWRRGAGSRFPLSRRVAAIVVVVLLGAIGFLPLFGGPGYEMSASPPAWCCPPRRPSRPPSSSRRAGTSRRLTAVARGRRPRRAPRGSCLPHLAAPRSSRRPLRLPGRLSPLRADGGGGVHARRALGRGRRRDVPCPQAPAPRLRPAGPRRPPRRHRGERRAFYGSPMVFSYDPFFGFFSGALYDTVVDVRPELWTYRAGTLATLTGGALLASALLRTSTASSPSAPSAATPPPSSASPSASPRSSSAPPSPPRGPPSATGRRRRPSRRPRRAHHGPPVRRRLPGLRAPRPGVAPAPRLRGRARRSRSASAPTSKGASPRSSSATPTRSAASWARPTPSRSPGGASLRPDVRLPAPHPRPRIAPRHGLLRARALPRRGRRRGPAQPGADRGRRRRHLAGRRRADGRAVGPRDAGPGDPPSIRASSLSASSARTRPRATPWPAPSSRGCSIPGATACSAHGCGGSIEALTGQSWSALEARFRDSLKALPCRRGHCTRGPSSSTRASGPAPSPTPSTPSTAAATSAGTSTASPAPSPSTTRRSPAIPHDWHARLDCARVDTTFLDEARGREESSPSRATTRCRSRRAIARRRRSPTTGLRPRARRRGWRA